MQNVAAYLMTLRQSRGYSRARLAELVGSSEMSILRIERQGQEPSGSLLVRLVDALGGSWDIVKRLLDDDREDALDYALNELREIAPDQRPAVPVDFQRFLSLVAEGMSPQEAAKIALHSPS